ncbi:alanyl-tRNA editing protein Aarsd1 [Thrips palmi]|uniref:Alanyl-tRNA editing protein Aarsd1 n=1 Tax=Thrips palmi TaxID=161013 RepID=A0A6P8ZW95_THRPL|nr:alanyl-tRNA editing protein Aarsd1 [Thrips palmi]
MVFACQNDSFLKELTTTVVSSKEAKIPCVNDGKKELIDGFEIILTDTILFPEGGGQPWDLGTINGKEVIKVTRRGAEAVHFLKYPFEVGQSVSVLLDWNRRLDHMQQHSGQHLITAVIAEEYGYATSSWWLGEEVSYLELDTPSISTDQVANAEKLVNQYIREARPVKVNVYESNNPELKKARTRGLPDDHVGLVRVVNIEGLENNMCCGTHVSNLSQLQMIKLTNVEKGKKGKIKLNFLAGNRVRNKMEEFLEREAALSNLLQNKGSMHVQLTEKIQNSLKISVKNLQNVLREVACMEAEKLKNTNPKPHHLILYRSEADMDFINSFLREFNDESVVLLLIVGEEPNLQLVLHGNPNRVACVGPKLCDVMGGKGFGKGSKFQAKVSKLKMTEVEQIFKET